MSLAHRYTALVLSLRVVAALRSQGLDHDDALWSCVYCMAGLSRISPADAEVPNTTPLAGEADSSSGGDSFLLPAAPSNASDEGVISSGTVAAVTLQLPPSSPSSSKQFSSSAKQLAERHTAAIISQAFEAGMLLTLSEALEAYQVWM